MVWRYACALLISLTSLRSAEGERKKICSLRTLHTTSMSARKNMYFPGSTSLCHNWPQAVAFLFHKTSSRPCTLTLRILTTRVRTTSHNVNDTSWAVDCCSGGKEACLWKPNMHHRVNKTPPAVPILSQLYPVHMLTQDPFKHFISSFKRL